MWIMLCKKTELQISSSLLLCNYHLIRNDVNTWIVLLRSSFERFYKPKPFLFRPMHYLGRVSKPACRFLLGWLRDKRKGKQHKCGEWCGGVRIRTLLYLLMSLVIHNSISCPVKGFQVMRRSVTFLTYQFE